MDRSIVKVRTIFVHYLLTLKGCGSGGGGGGGGGDIYARRKRKVWKNYYFLSKHSLAFLMWRLIFIIYNRSGI